jgi:hypothetical protein
MVEKAWVRHSKKAFRGSSQNNGKGYYPWMDQGVTAPEGQRVNDPSVTGQTADATPGSTGQEAYAYLRRIRRHTLLSGAAMKKNERINSGTAKKSPTTGRIRKPRKPNARANGRMINPMVRLDHFSLTQSCLFISDLQYGYVLTEIN